MIRSSPRSRLYGFQPQLAALDCRPAGLSLAPIVGIVYGGGDLAALAALDVGHIAQEHDTWRGARRAARGRGRRELQALGGLVLRNVTHHVTPSRDVT